MLQDRCQSWDAICRRAGGRRKYNHMRQIRAEMRLLRVVDLLGEFGFARGYQSRIARALNVSTSTVSRDIARLFLRYRGGREAEQRHQVRERMERRIRRENETERQRASAALSAPETETVERMKRHIRRENEAESQQTSAAPSAEAETVSAPSLVPEPKSPAVELTQTYEAPQSLPSVRSGMGEIFRPGPSHAERRRPTHRRMPSEGLRHGTYL